jgi:hypothetical protein
MRTSMHVPDSMVRGLELRKDPDTVSGLWVCSGHTKLASVKVGLMKQIFAALQSVNSMPQKSMFGLL